MADLVSRGRYPHQSLLKQWTQADKQAVEAAMAATNVSQLADRSVDELSGGQRQRVWVAMALAQQTPLLLLDEPTTYLDIAHQIELLDLFRQLNRERGQTLIAVLHDLNHACRYADRIIAMRDGKIVAEGKPGDHHRRTGGAGVRHAVHDHRRSAVPHAAGDPARPLPLRRAAGMKRPG